ncbi:cilia- and flagella-associated protein 418 [Gastrophryne carolinensis]
MADNEDDLERLLDEVESKYCRPRVGVRAVGDGGREPARPPKCAVPSSDDDVDDLIDDILDIHVNEGNSTRKTNSSDKITVKTANHRHSKKCCPVYLGGSVTPFGVGTNLSERACSRLRCTSCDFDVLNFDDYRWDTSCDYLFFRNSMPEHSKLQSKLVRKKGARAYACQCSWRSVHTLTEISTEQQLRWVCGKHSG